MLANTDAIAAVGVSDIAVARPFYGEVLELEENSERSHYPDFLTYRSGHGRAGLTIDLCGNQPGNCHYLDVGNRLEAIVAALAAKGVHFAHDDMPGMRLESEWHIAPVRNALGAGHFTAYTIRMCIRKWRVIPPFPDF